MRIGLISDTHLPQMGPTPPPEVEIAFRHVDLILHAGDIHTTECLDWLERIAPVIAVEKGPHPILDDPRVEERRVFELEGHTIGMMHDFAAPYLTEVLPGTLAKYPQGRSLSDDLERVFRARIDIVVFGDSHHAVSESRDDILFVNPGSPTLPRQVRRLGSVAIMELHPGEKHAEIVELVDFR
jgi:putative phosphoesterase